MNTLRVKNVVSFASILILCSMATISMNSATAAEPTDAQMEDARAVSENVTVDDIKVTTKTADGQPTETTLTFLQIFPTANPEYVCLAVMDSGQFQDMDCFPIKTNPTPTMY